MSKRLILVAALAGGCGLNVVGSVEPLIDTDTPDTVKSDTQRTVYDSDRASSSSDSAVPDGGVLSSSADADQPSEDADQPYLSYVQSDAPPKIDLTAEGTLDWIHWGAEAASPFANRKANVTPVVLGWTLTGAPTSISPSSNNPSSFGWNDGTPLATNSGTTSHVFFKGATNVTAEILLTTALELHSAHLYLGLNRTRARFEIDFDDGSVPRQSKEIERNDDALALNFTVDFRHPKKGAHLRVRWTMLTIVDPANSTTRIAGVSVK